jgi:hypothetical protein
MIFIKLAVYAQRPVRVDALIAVLFAPPREVRSPWLVRAWMAGLFAAGLGAWLYLLGFGRVPLDFHDWSGINIPRLTFLQNALRAGEWPLHMQGGVALHGVTDRFLALPDVITSPQTLLLLVMPVTTFVLVDVAIQFALGFAGVWLLRRYFEWSLFTFTAAVGLLLFNGHILAHYSVGHFTWGAYFLFPMVVWLVCRFLDGEAGWRWVACFAVTIAYMVLSGGQHHATWVWLLLALLAPFCRDRAGWLLAAVAASGLLSAVRLLPPVLELQSFRSAGLVSDVIGFPSVSHMLTALTVLRRETPSFNEMLPGNIWFFDSAYFEFSAFIGAVGLAILILGLFHWLRAATPRYPQLIAPVFVMTALSIGSTYRLVRALHIPLFEGERYTARLFSLPLVFMTVMALSAIDRVLRDASVALWHRVIALVGLALLMIDLASGVRLWRVAVSSGLFKADPFDPAITTVLQHRDPAYVNVVLAGAAISVLTAAALAVLARRSRT